MTREEQIQEAKDKAFPTPKEGRSYESAWAAGGFEMGAHWADEHPNLESLWHDVTEEPQEKEWEILCFSPDWTLALDPWILQDRFDKNWSEFVKSYDMQRWAYIEDLLPKGGEK